MFELSRPLMALDLETTGTDPGSDRIVEIALVDVESEATFESLVNPGEPIPPEASEVHGITDSKVETAPHFWEIAPRVVRFIGEAGCDFLVYGGLRFDIPLFLREMKMAGLPLSFPFKVIDAMAIYHKKEPRDLAAAHRFYRGREMEGAHGAFADAAATLSVFRAQMQIYPDLPPTLESLAEFCKPEPSQWCDSGKRFRWRFREPCFAFGKPGVKGRMLREVLSDYELAGFASWMLRNDFPKDTKELVQRALQGDIAVRETEP